MRFIKTEIHKHTGMKCEARPASGRREQAALTAQSSVFTHWTFKADSSFCYFHHLIFPSVQLPATAHADIKTQAQ